MDFSSPPPVLRQEAGWNRSGARSLGVVCSASANFRKVDTPISVWPFSYREITLPGISTMSPSLSCERFAVFLFSRSRSPRAIRSLSCISSTHTTSFRTRQIFAILVFIAYIWHPALIVLLNYSKNTISCPLVRRVTSPPFSSTYPLFLRNRYLII